MKTLELASNGLPVLIALVAFAIFAVRALSANAVEGGQPMSLLDRLRNSSLEALGVQRREGFRYRKTAKYDIELIPQATATELEWFNQTTSTLRTNTYLRAGCNLNVQGEIDKGTNFMIVAIGVRFINLPALTDPIIADCDAIKDFGLITDIFINESIWKEEIPIAECGLNLGNVALLTGAAAAVGGAGVCLGQPGFPDVGYVIEPFERFWIAGGQRIGVKMAHFKGANLTATRALGVYLYGIEEFQK